MCKCKYCVNGSKLRAITDKITDIDDKKFIEDFLFNYVPNIEEELSINEFILSKLRADGINTSLCHATRQNTTISALVDGLAKRN